MLSLALSIEISIEKMSDWNILRRCSSELRISDSTVEFWSHRTCLSKRLAALDMSAAGGWSYASAAFRLCIYTYTWTLKTFRFLSIHPGKFRGSLLVACDSESLGMLSRLGQHSATSLVRSPRKHTSRKSTSWACGRTRVYLESPLHRTDLLTQAEYLLKNDKLIWLWVWMVSTRRLLCCCPLFKN